MRKRVSLVLLMLVGTFLQAQYLIIGKDSISVNQFKTDYKYGLDNNGIDKTIASAEDFLLLQQFAADKKVDTTAAFREKMMDREGELRNKLFFPKQVLDPVLTEYIKDLQTERKVLVFMVQKTDGDTNNYQQIYDDVKAGKMTMEDAVSKYTKSSPTPFYIKPGSIDNSLYNELKNLPNNGITKFKDMPRYIGFAKVYDTRPTLGYMVFGTISYPKDDNSESIKSKIFADLKAGKPFQDVAKLYGANDHEKNNGGVVMGSPTLPDDIYAQFKGKKSGYYIPEPVLFGDKYFVFNIYNVEPYVLTEKNRDFYIRELNSSLYGELLQDKMVAYLKSDPTYKEFPDFQNIKKSYANFVAGKDNAVLYQYKKNKTTIGDIKKMIADKKSEVEKLSPAMWTEAIEGVNNQDVLKFYSENFANQPEVKKELTEFKKGLYSEYIFSKYISDEINKNPQWLTEYYNKNKSKYMWGNRADGRVAIISDENLVKEIAGGIKDDKKWEALQTKYYGKLNDKKQILVNFEKGEMSEDADVFTKYKVPFQTGVHQTKMGDRFLVIAIDKILPPSQMTEEEASEMLRDAVTEEKLKETIAAQKAKTKIVIEPGFMKDLEKNFKK